MTDAAEWKDVFPAEASIPDGIASLDSILCTDELRRRSWRPPDYEKENRALVALASALADPQSNILQIFAETILEVTQCDSSGLSLLTKDDGGKRFYWPRRRHADQWCSEVITRARCSLARSAIHCRFADRFAGL